MTRHLLVASVLAFAAVLLSACGERSTPSQTPQALGAPAQTYTVRGRLESLPPPEGAAREIRVFHEPIDDFVGDSGEVVGMGSMSMPFPLADDVDLTGLREGDLVTVEFAVWWEPQTYQATSVRLLRTPEPIELVDRPAAPPGSPLAVLIGEHGEPDAVYTTRGEVANLPSPDRPLDAFEVRHEEIPEFENPDGTLGMSSMTMPFPVAEGISLDGLERGQKVSLQFAVWWPPKTARLLYRVTRLDRLPPETELDFGDAD